MFYSKAKDAWIERIETEDGGFKELQSKDKNKLKRKVREFYQKTEDGYTFSQVADAWENAHTEHVQYKTAQAYAPHVRRAKEHFGNRLIKNITPYEVQAYIDSLEDRHYAKDTVHRALVVLNKIFNYAIAQPNSVVKFNPCSAVEIPKGLKKTRREPPTAAQLDKITPDGMGLFAWFIMYSGLRNGELYALRWEDIDRENKVIHVRRATHYVGNNPNITEKTKTEAGLRDVPLLDALADVLPASGKGYVFGGDKPLNREQFYREWTKYCVSIGLAEKHEETHIANNGHKYVRTTYKPLITPYQFRHEYASLLEEAGVSEFQAMRAMGHASIGVTKDVYTHIRERKRENDLATKMNKLISGEKVE